MLGCYCVLKSQFNCTGNSSQYFGSWFDILPFTIRMLMNKLDLCIKQSNRLHRHLYLLYL
jgi:hypothetical protein